jgi:hypothetical protein
MSVLYQKRSVLTINKTERIRRKLFKKMPSGVFEKFPFTFFPEHTSLLPERRDGMPEVEVST